MFISSSTHASNRNSNSASRARSQCICPPPACKETNNHQRMSLLLVRVSCMYVGATCVTTKMTCVNERLRLDHDTEYFVFVENCNPSFFVRHGQTGSYCPTIDTSVIAGVPRSHHCCSTKLLIVSELKTLATSYAVSRLGITSPLYLDPWLAYPISLTRPTA